MTRSLRSLYRTDVVGGAITRSLRSLYHTNLSLLSLHRDDLISLLRSCLEDEFQRELNISGSAAA
jgi:hypothetical protein